MRPVRFVALSEDGASLILTDEVGRMLTLGIDEPLVSAMQRDRAQAGRLPLDMDASLTPRDIQARIRAGDSAAAVARLANVPVEKVLRFAGPVLQERAAMVQLARRTRLKPSESGNTLEEVTDARLRHHDVDPTIAAWDAYRRDDGTWRIVAAWHTGDTAFEAAWDLNRARSVVTPVDEMAHFLSTERQSLLALDEPLEKMPMGSLRNGSAASKVFADDEDVDSREGPVVPALSMLRRESGKQAVREPVRERQTTMLDPVSSSPKRSRKDPLPTWDDILFGP